MILLQLKFIIRIFSRGKAKEEKGFYLFSHLISTPPRRLSPHINKSTSHLSLDVAFNIGGARSSDGPPHHPGSRTPAVCSRWFWNGSVCFNPSLNPLLSTSFIVVGLKPVVGWRWHFFCYNGGVAALCGNIMRMFFLCYVHLSIDGISLNCLPTFSGCPLRCRWLKGLPRVVIWCCIQCLDGCWQSVFRFTASVLMGRCCICFRLRRS